MLKSVNLLGLYVDDTAKAVSFYKDLGFQVNKDDGIVGEVEFNNFKISLISKDTASDQDESFQKDAFGEPKGTGVYLNIEVADIDDYYKQLVEKGIKPSSKPRNWPWQQREFVVRDPDRYKLVFYQKL